MSIRRLFWLGAAILFSIAALVAIAAVLGGSFGDTQGRILATCGIAFVSGAATLAGFACIDRGVIRPAAWVAVALGFGSFALWTGAAWQDSPGTGYWHVAGFFRVWTLTVLIVTTLRLLASSPRLLGTLVPATWAASSLAAAVWAGADVSQAAERLVGTLGNIDVLAVRGDGRSVTIGKSRTKLASSEGIVLRERS
jgi:hypothetical protein